MGSDSGRIIILEYNATKNILERVHQETFGKSGCRRIVPGQYLAIDPKGNNHVLHYSIKGRSHFSVWNRLLWFFGLCLGTVYTSSQFCLDLFMVSKA